MGYTHYYPRALELPRGAFSLASKDCRKVCEASCIELADFVGEEDPPTFTDNEISFNGPGKDGYESFVVHVIHSCPEGERPYLVASRSSSHWQHDLYFDFCKTERKPYDLCVMACLIVLKTYFPGHIQITSDGDDAGEEWNTARRLCHKTFGYGAFFHLEGCKARELS